eukprot:46651_1
MATEQKETLQVIGAGFGRTGTESLQLALNKLGYKCYHMHELKKYNDASIWYDLLKKPKDQRNWNDSLFAIRGYTATVDWPTTIIYEDLLKENPSAKVVLTIRDTPQQWFNSVNNSIWKLSSTREWWQFKLLSIFDSYAYKEKKVVDCIWKGVFDGRFPEKERSINIYLQHIENVKKIVPNDKLLIMNVKEGWPPLCHFLNKDIPKDIPFPRGNTTADKDKTYRQLIAKKNKVTKYIIILFLVVIACLYKYYRTKE